MVLDRPEIPLHTNGSENDIRCQVTRRKVSAGTRSDIRAGLPHDAFLSLAKTCDKLGIAIWDYLGSRFKVVGHLIIAPSRPLRQSTPPPRLMGANPNILLPGFWHSGAHGIPVPVVLPLLREPLSGLWPGSTSR